jgi:hypothetical protein
LPPFFTAIVEHLDETGDRGEPRVVVRTQRRRAKARSERARTRLLAPAGTRAHATPRDKRPRISPRVRLELCERASHTQELKVILANRLLAAERCLHLIEDGMRSL